MDPSHREQNSGPITSLITGIIFSISLMLFLYLGVRLSCGYLVQVTVTLFVLIIICSFVFWINLKHDHMSDLMNMTSSTVAFDFKFSRPGYMSSLSNVLKRINPFIGALATFSGILLLLWVLPAIIIHLISPDEILDTYIFLSAFLIDAVLCTAYVFSNREQFSKGTSIISFYAGIVAGSSGMYNILKFIFS